MKMKMTEAHQAWLRACIEKHGIFDYKTALMIIEPSSRNAQSWRVFHYVNKLEHFALSDTFYTYLNDSHIQTALNKILYAED